MPPNPLGIALRNRRAGQHTLAWADNALRAPENFVLTSPAFDGGTPMPRAYRGRMFGANISPALAWTRPPQGAVELALIVQDPDIPFRKPGNHVLAVGIDPTLGEIADNALANPSPLPGIRHGKGSLGRMGYTGPTPLRSHGPHTYAFQLFALDQATELVAGFTLDQLVAAITGHVIGRARLDGTYENR